MCVKRMSQLLFVLLLFSANARAQHLWWNLEGQRDATCLYGEITVLATHTNIYYCGANWHPGEPAGGYCGIQHNGPHERRTIFSIWDTAPDLHPRVTQADPETIYNRFGGEGEGAHTHMLWPWKEGQIFQFFVQKRPGAKAGTTDARYFVYEQARKSWRFSATITCPDGGKKSVATLGGGLNSFLENFAGKDREVPKLALYRLWLGSSLDQMKPLTRARGDGDWGQLHDAYFLAEGNPAKIKAILAELEPHFGKPSLGGHDKPLAPLSERPLPANLIAALKRLPGVE